MTCQVCGYQSPVPTGRCPRCGAPAAAQPPVPPQPPAPPTPPAAPPQQSWAPEGSWASQPTAPIPTSGGEPTAPLPPYSQGAQAAGVPQFEAPGAAASGAAWGSVPGPDGSWAGAPAASGYAVQPPPTKPKRSRAVVIGIIAAAVVLIAGAGVAGAAWFFGWFGGKTPADVLPANAAIYLRVDINPSMAQKTAALQYFRELPEVSKVVTGGGETDPRKALWNLIVDQSGDTLAGIDYAADIQPWLGDKAGVTLTPRAESAPNNYEPIVAVALQITDEAKARTGLAKVLATGSLKRDITIRDGYAIVTVADDTSQVLSDIAAGTLAQNGDFTADMRALGDTGLASAWLDLSRTYNMAMPVLPTSPASVQVQGRAAMAVRITGDTLELGGVLRGGDPTYTALTASGGGLGELPAGTGVGVNAQGAGKLLLENWDKLQETYGGYWSDLGIEMPDDMAALLGRDFSVAMSSDSMAALAGSDYENPIEIGLISVGDDPGLAQQTAQKLLSSAGAEYPDAVSDDTYTMATTEDYLAALTGGTGARLSSVEKFTKAVPDHAQSVASYYADLEAMKPWFAQYSDEQYRDFLTQLRSTGMSSRTTGSGEASWSFRLIRS